MLLGGGIDPAHGGPRVVVGPRHEHAARAPVDERADDGLDLVRRLALAQHRLRRVLAQLAMRVDAREAEVAIGQRGELLQGGAGVDLPLRDGVQEGQDLGALPECHVARPIRGTRATYRRALDPSTFQAG